MTFSHPIESDDRKYGYIFIFFLALIIRLIFISQIRNVPVFTCLLGDANGYDQWAQHIAAGNWLGDSVFYQAPFYPYFLACVYTLVGHNLLIVRLIQVLLGSIGAIYLAKAGRIFFDPTVGLASGILWAIYPSAVFFDGIIQKASLGVFFLIVLLYLLAKNIHEKKYIRWFYIGIVVSCIILLRENALIFFAILVIWTIGGMLFFDFRYYFVSLVLLIIGAGLTFAPVLYHNYKAGGQWILTTSQMGTNLYIGNNENATGVYKPLVWDRGNYSFEKIDATRIAESKSGRQLSPKEVSEYWRQKVFTYIQKHPLSWVKLLVRKSLYLVNHVEIPDTESQEAYASWSKILMILSSAFHFGVLFPLAIIGICITFEHRKKLIILYAMMLGFAAGVVAFYVMSRYRFFLVPFLILFAAAGLVRSVSLIRQKKYRTFMICAFMGLMTSLISNANVFPKTEMVSDTFFNLGDCLDTRGYMNQALYYYKKALKLNPDNERAMFLIGTVKERQGKVTEALSYYQEAINRNPDFFEAMNNLGALWAKQGQFEKATDCYRRVLERDPNNYEACFLMGQVLVDQKKDESAVQYFQKSIAANGNFIKAYNSLAMVLVRQGKLDNAINWLKKAILLNEQYLPGLINLGMIYESKGAFDNALKYLIRSATLSDHQTFFVEYTIASIYARLNQPEPACKWLEKSIAKGFSDQNLLIQDKRFDSIRTAKCYLKIIN